MRIVGTRSYLMSSSRSHSVWCLKCSLVICSVWVFFSSCVTLTWREGRGQDKYRICHLCTSAGEAQRNISAGIFKVLELTCAAVFILYAFNKQPWFEQIAFELNISKKKKNKCWQSKSSKRVTIFHNSFYRGFLIPLSAFGEYRFSSLLWFLPLLI